MLHRFPAIFDTVAHEPIEVTTEEAVEHSIRALCLRTPGTFVVTEFTITAPFVGFFEVVGIDETHPMTYEPAGKSAPVAYAPFALE